MPQNFSNISHIVRNNYLQAFNRLPAIWIKLHHHLCVCCHKHSLPCLFTSDVWCVRARLLIKASTTRSAHPPSDAISGPPDLHLWGGGGEGRGAAYYKVTLQTLSPSHPSLTPHGWSYLVITSVNVTVNSGSWEEIMKNESAEQLGRN